MKPIKCFSKQCNGNIVFDSTFPEDFERLFRKGYFQCPKCNHKITVEERFADVL